MGKRKPKPVSVLDCRPEDNCDGDPKRINPPPIAETGDALLEVRDWMRKRVESGELKPTKKRIDWEKLPRVTWVPTFFLAGGTQPAAGTTNEKGIKVSTMQSWRTINLVRHESCHWWYKKILGHYDWQHLQKYLA